MTRTLVQLQWLLWKRNLKGNPALIMMVLFTFIYGAAGFLSVGLGMGVETYDGAPIAIAGAVAIGTFVYVAVALMMPSGEKQLAPEAFATMPITTRDMLPALALSNLMQSRGVIASLCTLGMGLIAAFTLHSGLGVALLLPALILSLCNALLLGEAIAALLSAPMDRTKTERGVYIAAGVGMLVMLGYATFSSASTEGLFTYAAIGQVLVWTPLGAPAGIVVFAAEGAYLKAVASLAITLVTIALSAWLWWHSTSARLIAPLDQGSGSSKSERRGSGSLVLPGLKHTVGSMVYSRVVRYMRRDSRFVGSLILIPVFILFFLYQGRVNGDFQLYIGAGVMALLACSVAINDYGYDGPANWLHIATGVPAKTLVVARHLGAISVPFVGFIAYLVMMNLLAEDKNTSSLVTAGALGGFLVGAGVSVGLSAYNPFPTGKPGTNPWQDRSGFSGAALASSFILMLLGWVPVAPGVALMVWGSFTANTLLITLGVVLVLLIPAQLYAYLVRRSIRQVDQKYPEIFEKVRGYV